MNSLIEVINKLQDVFQTIDCNVIQLPQIAVVGTQSAGKSSVIESIVGCSFLPRGIGIVTRRPLVLQLFCCPLNDKKYRSIEKGTISLEGWGEFLHKDGEIFTDFDAIRKEIEIDTNRVAGDNKGICDEPIHLRIYYTNLVELTLVDLPGMTKNPVGDQPKDIEAQIKKLIFKYIGNENCIILAVTEATVDMATSEALKFAKEADPNGTRTLAVLTKLDSMDEGTNAIDVLDGTVLPVKMGIVGVVNRSQEDIDAHTTFEEQLAKETEFFQKNYPDFVDRSGTKYLAATLSNVLIHHIHKHMPELQKRVALMISQNQALLKSYRDVAIDKEQTLIQIITKFSKSFQTTVYGTIRKANSIYNTALYRVIHDDFEMTLDAIQPIVDKNQAIDALRKIFPGPRPHLFDGPSFDVPFEDLVKVHIAKLMEPSVALISHVHEEIKQNVLHCDADLKAEWKRFPKLRAKVFDSMRNLLNGRIDIARHFVKNLIESELAYINKRHPDFHKEKAITPLVTYQQSIAGPMLSATRGEKEICEVLQNLVKSYFEVVRKTVLDAVPKTIMHTMVNFVVENVESELFARVYRAEGYDTLLDEESSISRKREHARSMLQALTRANEIIVEIHEVDNSFPGSCGHCYHCPCFIK